VRIRGVDRVLHFGEEHLHRRVPALFELGLVLEKPHAVVVLGELLEERPTRVCETCKAFGSGHGASSQCGMARPSLHGLPHLRSRTRLTDMRGTRRPPACLMEEEAANAG